MQPQCRELRRHLMINDTACWTFPLLMKTTILGYQIERISILLFSQIHSNDTNQHLGLWIIFCKAKLNYFDIHNMMRNTAKSRLLELDESSKKRMIQYSPCETKSDAFWNQWGLGFFSLARNIESAFWSWVGYSASLFPKNIIPTRMLVGLCHLFRDKELPIFKPIKLVHAQTPSTSWKAFPCISHENKSMSKCLNMI